MGIYASIALAVFSLVSWGFTERAWSQDLLSGRYGYLPGKIAPGALKRPSKPQPNSVWTVEIEKTPTQYLGCTGVTKPDSSGVVLSIYLDRNDPRTVTIGFYGIDFGIDSASSSLGLLQFDDADPFEVSGRKIAPWRTEIIVSEHKEDKDSLLHQFGRSSKINILLGNLRYTTDLKGSGDMLTSMQVCMKGGQAKLNRDRLANASTAKTVGE